MSEDQKKHPQESSPPSAGDYHFSRSLDDKTVRLTHDQLSQAYDSIHARGGLLAVRGYYRWLLSLVRARPGARFLDVGCGTGEMLKQAAEAGFVVSGIDISRVGIEQAQARVPQADLHVGVAERLPFADSSFDMVTCVGSLEHVADPAQAVREMRRVARPDAQMLIIVPNSRYIWAWIVHLRQWLFPALSQPVERHATRTQWQKFLSDNGLRVRAVHKDNHSYVPTRFLQMLGAALGALAPRELSYQLVFVAEPGETV